MFDEFSLRCNTYIEKEKRLQQLTKFVLYDFKVKMRGEKVAAKMAPAAVEGCRNRQWKLEGKVEGLILQRQKFSIQRSLAFKLFIKLAP